MINRHLAIYNYKGSNKYESLDVFNFKLNSLFVDFKYRPITIKFIVEEEESNFTLDELFFDGNCIFFI
jgi:hypothetical protein